MKSDQQLDQDSPASIIVGRKVVVVYFDGNTLQADKSFPAWGEGYSVSHDGGKSFTDEGELSQNANANNQAYAGTLAADAQGNVWMAQQSNDPLDAIPPAVDSRTVLYEMPRGSDRFTLVSVPEIDTKSLARRACPGDRSRRSRPRALLHHIHQILDSGTGRRPDRLARHDPPGAAR